MSVKFGSSSVVVVVGWVLFCLFATACGTVCYSCAYHKFSDGDDGFHGDTNCNDPFNEERVNVVRCAGSCGKLFTISKSGDAMLIRGCMPKCTERKKDDGTFVKCCKSNLCNASVSTHAGSSPHHILLLVVAAVFGLTVTRLVLTGSGFNQRLPVP